MTGSPDILAEAGWYQGRSVDHRPALDRVEAEGHLVADWFAAVVSELDGLVLEFERNGRGQLRPADDGIRRALRSTQSGLAARCCPSGIHITNTSYSWSLRTVIGMQATRMSFDALVVPLMRRWSHSSADLGSTPLTSSRCVLALPRGRCARPGWT